jgi:enoyl-CoA hydratase/carnithine racemase
MTTNPRAKIGLNETALGVRFPPRILAILRRRLPAQHVDRLLLGGDLVGPSDARELGFVDEIADDPVAAAKSRLAILAAHPAAAYAQTKADLRGASPSDLCPDASHEEILRGALATWTSSGVKEKLLRVLGK